MDNTYNLIYRVDTSQAGPAFSGIRRDLVEVKNDLLAIVPAATAVSSAMQGMVSGASAAGTAMNNLNAQAQTSLGGILSQTESVTHHTGLFNEGVASTFLKFKALEFVPELVGKIGEQINNARERLKELAQEAMATRQEMRELAALQGKDGPDDSVTGGAVHFGMGAGMKPAEAARYLEQFYGSAETGIDKGNIGDGRRPGETQEQYEERIRPLAEAIAAEGARFGQRMKIDPKTAGDITGVLSQHEKVRSPEEAAQKLGRIGKALQDGRGNMEPLMRSLADISGALVGEGIVEDNEELAVMLGAMSTSHRPREAGTYLNKGIRELRQFAGPQGEGLQAMGITPEMSHRQALHKVKDMLDDASAKGIAPDIALRGHGFADEAGLRAIIEETRSLDVAEQRLAENKNITGAQVQAQNERFFTRDYSGIKLKLDADKAGNDWLTGRSQEPWQLARAAAVQRMRDNGELADGEAKFADLIWDAGGILPWMGVPSAMEKRINENAYRHLEAEAKKIGGRTYAAFREETEVFQDFDGVSRSVFDKHSSFGQAEAPLFDKLVPKILDAGGAPFAVGHARERVKARADGVPFRNPAPAQAPAGGAPRQPIAAPPGARARVQGGMAVPKFNPGGMAGQNANKPVTMEDNAIPSLLKQLIDATLAQTAIVAQADGGLPQVGGFAPKRS